MKTNKVLHFESGFSASEINTYLDGNVDTLYFTRNIDDKNELHVVKYSENAQFKLTGFVSQILKFYEKNTDFVKYLKDVKLKGNDNFVIIENTNPNLIEKLKNDFNTLLIK
jgi:hypothetical protein